MGLFNPQYTTSFLDDNSVDTQVQEKTVTEKEPTQRETIDTFFARNKFLNTFKNVLDSVGISVSLFLTLSIAGVVFYFWKYK